MIEVLNWIDQHKATFCLIGFVASWLLFALSAATEAFRRCDK